MCVKGDYAIKITIRTN